MTNGDRIRQMSNEELAEHVMIKPCEICMYYENRQECETKPCKEGILAYLESEVE